MLQISQNIKKIRELRGKTQDEIAKSMGIKRTTYANWETNTEPDLTKIMELATLLGVHYTTIIEWDGKVPLDAQGSYAMKTTIKDSSSENIDVVLPINSDAWKEAYKDLKELSLSNNNVFTQAFANIADLLKEVREVKTNLKDEAYNQHVFRVMTVERQRVVLENIALLRGLTRYELLHEADSIAAERLDEYEKMHTVSSDTENK